MKNHIYLRRIAARGFRVFREPTTIDLIGPGVNIIVGQNGLGKTSVFEAIEWALCGRVLRLALLPSEESRVPDPEIYYANYSRTDLPAAQFGVSLQFADHEGGGCRDLSSSRRSDGSGWVPGDTDSSAQEIIAALKSPEWELKVQDVASYLRQTHFFAQSSQARLAGMDKKDRAESLALPAGFGKLEEAQRILGGSATRKFGERVKAEEDRLAGAQKRRDGYLTKLTDYRERQGAHGAGGAVAPDTAVVRWTSLRDALEGVLETLTGRRGSPAQSGGAAVAALLEEIEPAVAAQRSRLTESRDIPARRRTASLEQAASRAQLASQQALEGSARRNLESIVQSFALKEPAAESMHAEASRLAAELTVLRRVADAFALRERTLPMLSEAEHRSDLNDKELAKTDAAARAANEELRAALREVEEETRYANVKKQSEKLLDLVRCLEADWRAVQPQIAIRAVLVAGLREARAARQSLDERLEAEEGTIAKIEVQEASARGKDETIVHALAAIFAVLDDHSQDCPVCGSEFEPGQLRDRALARLGAQNPALASLGRALSEARGAFAASARERDTIDEKIVGFKTELAELDRTEAELEIRWRALEGEGLLEGIPRAKASLFLEEKARRADDELAKLAARRAGGQALGALREAVERTANEHAAVTSQSQALTEEVDHLRQTLVETDRIIVQEPESAARLGREPADRAAALSVALRHKDDLDRAFIEAKSEVSALGARQVEARKALDDLSMQVAHLSDTFESKGKQLASIDARWVTAGLEGVPEEAVVETALGRLAEIEANLARYKSDRDLLEQGTQRWKQLRDSDRQRQELDDAKDDNWPKADDEGWLAKLNRDVEAIETNLREIRWARDKVKGLADVLRDKNADYVKNVLNPFNELAHQFYLALSSFPARRMELDPNTTKLGTALSMRVRMHDRTLKREDAKPLSAPHLLSEGQLASWSLSLLFAMSTGYSWSRWPAVLMDDPLQQCDIVHAASLADLAGNLVLERDYQIILSTHDFGLADYLQRKFDARGIRCKRIAFLNPGRLPASL